MALGQSGEEPGHALVLVQRGVALKRLLDQPPQLLGLKTHTNTHIELEMKVGFRPRRETKIQEEYLHAVDQLFGEEQVQTHVLPDGAEEPPS